MNESILVSVIIPVYNTEKYIRDCMESVLNQTHSNIEVILINDGSKDSSAGVCGEYASDPRVRYIDRENRGLSQTRKQGIELAKGEYFCNLDSDDCLDLHFVEKMLDKIVETKADVVTCGRKDFDDGHERDIDLIADHKVYTLTKDSVEEKIYDFHRKLWLSDSWNKLYRTDFVRSTGVEYCLDNRYNGTDLLFNHLLALYCPKIAVLNEPLLLHRIVQGSRVHRKRKPLQEGFNFITDTVLSKAHSLGYSDKFDKAYALCFFAFMKMVVVSIISESESTDELQTRFSEYKNMLANFLTEHSLMNPAEVSMHGTGIYEKKISKVIKYGRYFDLKIAYGLNKIRKGMKNERWY